MYSILSRPIEIVGISSGLDGRLCGLHRNNCGSAIRVGSILKIRHATITMMIKTKVLIQNIASSNQPKKVGRPKKEIEQYKLELIPTQVETLKVFLTIEAIESCFVGYVSSAFQQIYKNQLDGRVLKVLRIMAESDSESERQRNKELNGNALTIIVA